MSTSNEPLRTLLGEIMERKGRLPSQLAADLGISHATVSRWLSGADVPCTRSCRMLASYAGVPMERVLSAAGHLAPLTDRGPAEWPEFREYARRKYGRELDEDMITMIEDLIERRRKKNKL